MGGITEAEVGARCLAMALCDMSEEPNLFAQATLSTYDPVTATRIAARFMDDPLIELRRLTDSDLSRLIEWSVERYGERVSCFDSFPSERDRNSGQGVSINASYRQRPIVGAEPCPFCGSADPVYEIAPSINSGGVRCRRCHAWVGRDIELTDPDWGAKALAAWNLRVR